MKNKHKKKQAFLIFTVQHTEKYSRTEQHGIQELAHRFVSLKVHKGLYVGNFLYHSKVLSIQKHMNV